MRIHDITLSVSESMVVWSGDPPVKMPKVQQLEQGDFCTVTRLELGAHVGTHVDAPAHFIKGGSAVEMLDLGVLVGPALVVHALEADQITATVLDSLQIPHGTERLLIRTRNSETWASTGESFIEDYVAVEADGADWLVGRNVKLVGVDYLSVAPYHDLVSTHQILLGAGIIPVEGLDLRGIQPGIYQLVCLPVKLDGSDGAPVRAILID